MPNMFFMPKVTLVAMWVFILAALMMADSVTMRGTVMSFRHSPFGNWDFNFVFYMTQVEAFYAVLLAHFMPCLWLRRLCPRLSWLHRIPQHRFLRATSLAAELRLQPPWGQLWHRVSQVIVVIKLTFMRTFLKPAKADS